jgi:hypothetical protein
MTLVVVPRVYIAVRLQFLLRFEYVAVSELVLAEAGMLALTMGSGAAGGVAECKFEGLPGDRVRGSGVSVGPDAHS